MAQVNRQTFEQLRDAAHGAADIDIDGAWRAAPDAPRRAPAHGSVSHRVAAALRLGEVPTAMLVAVAVLALVAVVLGAVLLGRRPPAVTIARDDAADAAPAAISAPAGQADAGSSAQEGAHDDAASQGDAAGGSTEAPLYVHVAGAVAAPGVYGLAAGARVLDAVEAAGGLLADADTAPINLAQPVSDGCKVWIPAIGETEAAAQGAGAVQGAGTAADGAAGTVNVNVADEAALQGLPGVGEVLAAAIVRDREANGPFASPEDLMRVSGIGEKKFENMRAMVQV